MCFYRFIEYGEYKENLYGTSLESIHRVLDQKKVCLVDVQPEVSWWAAQLVIAELPQRCDRSCFLLENRFWNLSLCSFLVSSKSREISSKSPKLLPMYSFHNTDTVSNSFHVAVRISTKQMLWHSLASLNWEWWLCHQFPLMFAWAFSKPVSSSVMDLISCELTFLLL